MKRYKSVVMLLLAVIIYATSDLPVDYYKIVRQMGYADVGETPVEIVKVKIPENFGKVYENYNNLLKSGGFDLSLYKGRVVKRYTYMIPSVNARANILVFEGRIIGGDISGITLDGIMIPIKRSEHYET